MGETYTMATEATTQRDTLKLEKLSLAVLGVCVVVLVYLLVWHPF
jgi:hypothetical protein